MSGLGVTMLTVLRTAALVLTVPAAASAATVAPGIGDFFWGGNSLGVALKAKDAAVFRPADGVDLNAIIAAKYNAAPEFTPELSSMVETPTDVLAPLITVAFGATGPSVLMASQNPATPVMEKVTQNISEAMDMLDALSIDEAMLANLPSIGAMPEMIGAPFEPFAAAASLRINTGVELLLTGYAGDAEIAELTLYGITPAAGGSGGGGGTTSSSASASASSGSSSTTLFGTGSGGGGSSSSSGSASAATAYNGADPAPVPLPAGGVLLLAGLVALRQLRKKSG